MNRCRASLVGWPDRSPKHRFGSEAWLENGTELAVQEVLSSFFSFSGRRPSRPNGNEIRISYLKLVYVGRYIGTRHHRHE